MLRILISLAVLVSMTTAFHFDHKFEYRLCDEIHCVDPIWSKGPCSLVCPQGQTCRHPRYGTVLKADMVHDIDGQKCICKDTLFPDWDIAYCAV